MRVPVLAGHEALDPSRGVDYIVPYPYSSNIRLDEAGQLEPFLSKLSEMSLHAAAIVWEQHQAAQIVIPGETPYGPSLPNTSDLMVAKAERDFGIPADRLVPMYNLPAGTAWGGQGLNNTYLQTRGLDDWFDFEFGYSGDNKNVLGIALEYHTPRVRRTLEVFDMAPDLVTAEAVLHAGGVTDYDKYQKVIAGLRGRELINYCLTTPFRKGLIPNLIMQRTGPLVIDVVEDEVGRLRLEKDFARSKQARLLRQAAPARAEAA